MKIAGCFPGIGYNCNKPLLFYSKLIVTERGFDEVVNISYTSDIQLDKTNIETVANILYNQAEKELETKDWKKYDEVVFFAKSIGTVVSCEYAYRHNIFAKQILYTPLCETFNHFPQNAIAFSGTKDQRTNHELVVKLCEERNIPIFVVEGVNHSLERKETNIDIEILMKIMKWTCEFI